MTLTALAFAAGAALLQQQAQLPGLAWLVLLPLCIGLAVLRWRGAAVFALASGLLWAVACAHWRMADWLSPELEGRDLEVVGVVAGLPALGERSVRFEFDVESAAQKLPSKIQLSWYRSGMYEDQPAPLPSPARFIPARAGASRCGCAGRTAPSIQTASTTRRGCSSAASALPATSARAASN